MSIPFPLKNTDAGNLSFVFPSSSVSAEARSAQLLFRSSFIAFGDGIARPSPHAESRPQEAIINSFGFSYRNFALILNISQHAQQQCPAPVGQPAEHHWQSLLGW
jgi:hypothetical protein